MAEGWTNPSHLTLFKAEPLRGVGVLEIQPTLGLALVDRLMGGTGEAPEPIQEMSEIERALIEQAVEIIVGEWCSNWRAIKELKPALLGSESNGQFVQTSSPEANMLLIQLEATFGEYTSSIQIGFPHASIEPLIRQLSQTGEPAPGQGTPATAPAPVKWNPCLNAVRIRLAAEWPGLELTGREVLNIKPGDLLKFDPQFSEQLQLRVGGVVKFKARLGTAGGKWAVALTEIIRS
jgi:flagellar motor switch protein FliM